MHTYMHAVYMCVHANNYALVQTHENMYLYIYVHAACMYAGSHVCLSVSYLNWNAMDGLLLNEWVSVIMCVSPCAHCTCVLDWMMGD